MKLRFFHLNMWRTLILLICVYIAYGDNDENWGARFFPFGPGETDKNPEESEDYLKTMMSVDVHCDDGKTNLTVDWGGTDWEHSCYMPRSFYRPNPQIRPSFKCEHVPKKYSANHICMNQTISYDWSIPTYGPHRPVWAKYGEYTYLPKQRWLHNLEHGGVVMLYHPCANLNEVERLKRIVKKCLWRHIITPERSLSEERPLVLLTWGCKLELSYVHVPLVKAFIKKHALQGPEQIHRDGLYTLGLKTAADFVSNKFDNLLCPDVSHM